MKSGIIILLACLCLPLEAAAESTQKLHLGRTRDWTSIVSARILADAYAPLGIAVTISSLPAERSLVKSNSGSLDGEVNRIAEIDKDYPNLIRVPVPVNHVTMCAFSKEHDFTPAGWQSLAPYTIAIRIGIKIVEYRTRGMQVAAFSDDEKIFTLVNEGRYDVGVAACFTGLILIRQHNLKGIKRLMPPLEKVPLYHYLHKRHEALVPRIIIRLRQMQQDGSFATIAEETMNRLLRSKTKSQP